jgi:hypothetical protein
MKRFEIFDPPQHGEPGQTFATAEDITRFLFREMTTRGLPYLAVPYLAYGFATPDEPRERTVLSRPRVYVVPSPDLRAFRFHVEVLQAAEFEEVERGGWRVDERYERYEPVEPERYFFVSDFWRAREGRFDGVRELLIEFSDPAVRVYAPNGPEGGPGRELDLGKRSEVDEAEMGTVWFTVPSRRWLRLSLEEPAKLRTEETEMLELQMLAEF